MQRNPSSRSEADEPGYLIHMRNRLTVGSDRGGLAPKFSVFHRLPSSSICNTFIRFDFLSPEAIDAIMAIPSFPLDRQTTFPAEVPGASAAWTILIPVLLDDQLVHLRVTCSCADDLTCSA